MIKADQPKLFDSSVIAAVSSREDGQMQHGWSESEAEVNANRQAFLKSIGLIMEQSVFVNVRYLEGATYDVIRDVDLMDAGAGMFARGDDATDCLVTDTPELGLFLPVADCGATIVHDPRCGVLALAHLGRHNAVAGLATKLVAHLQKVYHSDPADLRIWVSPSIQKAEYVMEWVDFTAGNDDWKDFYHPAKGGYSVDVQGFNRAQFIKAGVLASQICISPINTATSEDYWSHYTERTVKGGVAPPRFAVATALKEQ
jgi:copper oxidase (laccase) domain-containing protein